MDRGVDIPWVGGRYTMGRVVKIPWLGGSIIDANPFLVQSVTKS